MRSTEQDSLTPDLELGTALREALASHHDGAFLTRVRARMARPTPSWDQELAHWFWRGLAAATAAMVLAGFGLSRAVASAPEQVEDVSIASDLLLGNQPGVDLILVSMQDQQ